MFIEGPIWPKESVLISNKTEEVKYGRNGRVRYGYGFKSHVPYLTEFVTGTGVFFYAVTVTRTVSCPRQADEPSRMWAAQLRFFAAACRRCFNSISAEPHKEL